MAEDVEARAMINSIVAIVEPLVRRRIFPSEEDAVRELVADFILRQIDESRAKIAELESRYSMSHERFNAYLKERSSLLITGQLGPEQRKKVAQAVMQEEEDWLDWKIAHDTLQDWLGLQAEVAT